MRALAIVAALAAVFGALAPADAAITKGPYLQNPRPHAMTICFETDEPGDAVVRVGEADPPDLSFTGSGEPFSYGGATVYQYKIEATGLRPAALYYYRVAAGAAASPTYAFATEPDELTSFRFAVIGDTRGGSFAEPNLEHEGIAAAVLAEAPDLFFNTGDLVRAGASLPDWEYFFFAEAELMAYTPFFGIFGNHEDDEEGGLTGDTNWARYFAPPPGSRYPTFYSFDYVNVHFVVIDVEKWATLALPGALQSKWLRDDLDAAQRNSRINFIFALFHEPPFSFEEDRTGNWASILFLQPVLKEYGVAAAFEGHDHFYARRTLGGVDHVVTGGGGAPLYDFRTFPPPQAYPGYRMHDKSNHYLTVDVTDRRVTVRAVRLDGSLIEEFAYEAEPPDWTDDDDNDDSDNNDDNDDNNDNDDNDPASSGTAGDDDDDSGGCGC